MGDTAEEIELKLALTEAELKGLKTTVAPVGFEVGRPATRKLVSIYYDTPEGALAQRKWVLRVRKVGRRYVQTAKCGPGVVAGLSSTLEVECPVPGPDVRPECIPDEGVRTRLAELVGCSPLVPVLETRIRRTTRIFFTNGGDTAIELALDAGEVVADGRSARVMEAELELKSGPVHALFDLAKKLIGPMSARFSTLTKAERGQVLRAGGTPDAPPGPRTAGPVAIVAGETAEHALRAILRSCRDQIAHNRTAVLESELPEGPHQLRVGLRRLRSALKIYQPLLETTSRKALDDQAARLAALVGPLRDLDVLAGDIIAPLTGMMPDQFKPDDLLAAIAEQRVAVRDSIREHLAEKAVNDFIFDLAAYTEGRGWLAADDFNQTARLAQPVEEFAAKALNKRWKRVAKYGASIEALTIEERHSMRKALKKFRYGLEFFRPLYHGKDVKPFLSRLKKLQNLFGYLNDVAMAEKLVDLPVSDRGGVDPIGLAAGFVIGWHGAEARHAWKNAKAAWDDTRKIEKFWR